MKTSEQTDKIIPAMIKARQSMRGVGKSQENKFDGYRYATIEDYMKVIEKPLEENGIVLVSTVTETKELPARKTSKGAEAFVFAVRMSFTAVHTSGQWVQVEAVGEGQDRADKAPYKAITGCRKYGIPCLFNLVTTDDPESDPDSSDNLIPTQSEPRPAGMRPASIEESI